MNPHIPSRKSNLFSLMVAGLLCTACQTGTGRTQPAKASVVVPTFQADSAYAYVKAQVDFGPRVPNTPAHTACGDYLVGQLRQFGAHVYEQQMDLVRYDGHRLKARNIVGAFLPDAKKRVALFAHWDSRPWADKDPDPTQHRNPILGANDGASGVGVLLEIARLMQHTQPQIGIDLILFDAEDAGAPDFYEGEHKETYWCLGSQYWARIPHVKDYNARFGILLDMVGGKDARFYREAYSVHYAKSVVEKVWRKAHEAGFGHVFVPADGGGVTDDHVFVNEIAGIPTIDIIPMDDDFGFGSFWHTSADNMDIIDRATLQAVGQTIVQVIYNEK